MPKQCLKVQRKAKARMRVVNAVAREYLVLSDEFTSNKLSVVVAIASSFTEKLFLHCIKVAKETQQEHTSASDL